MRGERKKKTYICINCLHWMAEMAEKQKSRTRREEKERTEQQQNSSNHVSEWNVIEYDGREHCYIFMTRVCSCVCVCTRCVCEKNLSTYGKWSPSEFGVRSTKFDTLGMLQSDRHRRQHAHRIARHCGPSCIATVKQHSHSEMGTEQANICDTHSHNILCMYQIHFVHAMIRVGVFVSMCFVTKQNYITPRTGIHEVFCLHVSVCVQIDIWWLYMPFYLNNIPYLLISICGVSAVSTPCTCAATVIWIRWCRHFCAMNSDKFVTIYSVLGWQGARMAPNPQIPRVENHPPSSASYTQSTPTDSCEWAKRRTASYNTSPDMSGYWYTCIRRFMSPRA